MMISTRGRYALRVMIDLAQHNDGSYISIKEISERQEVSLKYLEAIVSTLTKGNLLFSLRGKLGGYRLSRRPEDYTLGDILRLTEGSLAPVACLEGEYGCTRVKECLTLQVWKDLDDLINNYLDSVTLKDIVDGKVGKKE